MDAKKPYLGLLTSIVFISAAVFGYQFLLLTFLDIIQWHQFAVLILNMALLGFGMSGLLIARYRGSLLDSFKFWFCTFCFLFSSLAIICWLIAQFVPFAPPLLLRGAAQTVYLMLMCLLLSLPFLCAAIAVGLCFCHRHDKISAVYAAHLVGAALGALLVTTGLTLLTPQHMLIILSSLGILAILFQLTGRLAKWLLGVFMLGLIAVTVVTCNFAQKSFPLNISPAKPLPVAMQTTGARVDTSVYNQFGMVSVVMNEQTPLEHAPGLSQEYSGQLPKQLATYRNATNMTVINQVSESLQDIHYVNALPSALAYSLLTKPRVAIIGAGGGTPIWQARLHQAQQINVIEPNTRLTQLLTFSRFDDTLYAAPNIFVYPQHARRFFSSHDARFDLIQITRIATRDSLSRLAPDYTLTNEALSLYLKRLSQDGYLSMSLPTGDSSRSVLKLTNMLIDTLRSLGKKYEDHVILISSQQAIVCLVKNTKLTASDIVSAKQFLSSNKFKAIFYPGFLKRNANVILPTMKYTQPIAALLSEKGAVFKSSFQYDISPATDEFPYFSHFFRLNLLSALWSTPNPEGLAAGQWFYLVLALTVVMLLLISSYALFHTWRQVEQRSGLLAVVLYFLLIGAAFSIIQVIAGQRILLLLQDSMLTTLVTQTGLLLSAACGSVATSILFGGAQKPKFQRILVLLIYGILLSLIFIYTYLLGNSDLYLPDLTPYAHMMQLMLLISPLAFMMGMPFPIGLDWVARRYTQYIPIAWSAHAFGLVNGAVLAAALLVKLSFVTVSMCAILLYGVASHLLTRK